MSGRNPSGHSRRPSEEGEGSASSDQGPETRTSPLHLSLSEPHSMHIMPPRGSPIDQRHMHPMGASRMSPIHNPAYAYPPRQPSMIAPPRGHPTMTVTPESGRLLHPDVMSPPASTSRRRMLTPGSGVSSISPPKRSRIGEFPWVNFLLLLSFRLHRVGGFAVNVTGDLVSSCWSMRFCFNGCMFA